MEDIQIPVLWAPFLMANLRAQAPLELKAAITVAGSGPLSISCLLEKICSDTGEAQVGQGWAGPDGPNGTGLPF